MKLMEIEKTIFVLLIASALLFVFAIPPAWALEENVLPSATRKVRVRVFPTADDTWSILHYPYMWTQGDYIEGTRNLGTSIRITHIAIHLELSYSSLWGIGEVDIDVYLDGIKAGSFKILPGEFSKDLLFGGLSISVPDGIVTIKYLETNTVASGYGSITISSVYSGVMIAGW